MQIHIHEESQTFPSKKIVNVHRTDERFVADQDKYCMGFIQAFKEGQIE
jgi:hypothetical protein